MIRRLQQFIAGKFGASFQRFLHNFAAQGCGQVVNIGMQIVALPTFLHYWTKTEYGEWLVLTSIPSLLWTLDTGLSGLAANRMTIASGSGDWRAVNLIFHNVLLIQGLLSLLILAAVGGFAAFGNVSAAFGFTLIGRREAGEILVIMILFMLMGYGLGLMRAAYRACLLEARGMTMVNLERLTNFAALIIILTCHGHALAVAWSQLATMSFWMVWAYFDVRRRCPQITFSFGPLSRTQAGRMLVDGLPVMAGSAANAFFLQGYPLIVNSVLGPVAVVTLTAIRTASRALLQVVGMVSNASGPEMSRSYGSRDWVGYLRLLKVLLAVTVWSSLAMGVVLTVAGPWLIEKWSFGGVRVDHPIMLLFAISVACQSGWSACGSILFSTNMHHAFNYVYLALTLAGLAAAALVTRHLGFAGVPLVMVVTDALLLGWTLHLCRRKLSFISLASLAGILHPAFYLRKLDHLCRGVRHRSA